MKLNGVGKAAIGIGVASIVWNVYKQEKNSGGMSIGAMLPMLTHGALVTAAIVVAVILLAGRA
jgi:hypothetical protein